MDAHTLASTMACSVCTSLPATNSTIPSAYNSAVLSCFLFFQESIGQAWTFYGFGAIGMIAIAFIFSTVPETKGLTLEQIQADLAPGGGSARHPV